MRLPEFDEHWYLATYADVAEAVRIGQIRSGRAHYIRFGFGEGRLRNAKAELEYAAEAADGLNDGRQTLEVPSIEYMLRLPERLVVIGRCTEAVMATDFHSADDIPLDIKLVTTHQRAGRTSPLGFMLIADLDSERPTPTSIAFGGRMLQRLVRLPAPSEFGKFCNFAATEPVLEFLLATEQLGLSDEAMALLTRAVRGRLLQSSRSYIETPTFAASIDNAVVGRTTGSVFFGGWLLHSRHAQQINARFMALSNSRTMPLATLTDFVERPDLKGFSGKYAVPVSPGFVGYAGSAGKPPLGGDIILIVKDSTGRIYTTHRPLDIIDEPALHTIVVNQLATAAAKPDSRKVIGALFAELFPFNIATPAANITPLFADREPRTCHLYLDLSSEPTELQSILEEIIRDRFERLVVTCLSEHAEGEVSGALRAFAMSNPEKQITGRVVASRSRFLRVGPLAEAQDLVIFGRPLDILQFDAQHGAIDAAIRQSNGEAAKCHGYFYHELSAIRLHNASLSTETLVGHLNEHMFENTTGFAAFMPLGYFKLLDSDKIPLAFPSNEVKALVLELAKAGLAEIHFFGDTVFYGSANDPDKVPGLDNQILAQVDFFRTLTKAATTNGHD
jgi:hypothetical protein